MFLDGFCGNYTFIKRGFFKYGFSLKIILQEITIFKHNNPILGCINLIYLCSFFINEHIEPSCINNLSVGFFLLHYISIYPLKYSLIRMASGLKFWVIKGLSDGLIYLYIFSLIIKEHRPPKLKESKIYCHIFCKI